MKSIKITYIILLFTMTSCAEDWLDIKQNKSVVVPQTLSDLAALMDNSDIMLYTTPMLGMLAADNLYLTSEDWNSLAYPYEKNAYVWADDIYEGNTNYNWNTPYAAVLVTNIVLEGLKKIDPSRGQQADWNHIRGRALFYRSWMFYHLTQVFCRQYNHESANVNLGIPLRLESDINITSTRASLQETYEQIVNDLLESLSLLPEVPVIKTRPGLAAAHGLLARVYLQMSNFEEAEKHAEAALDIQSALLDFNMLDTDRSYPFEQLNEEVIFHTTLYPFSQYIKISSELYDKYDSGDLRKKLFFREDQDLIHFRGSYDANITLFAGLATDEMYLIKAECQARSQNQVAALTTLNELLVTRWTTGSFEPYTRSGEVLEEILLERRKSLLFRGIRWMDLKRLNLESEHATILERTLNGNEYQLLSNSPRYAFPIPDDVISLSGIEQNLY
ncbi:MAG: RagB/SusD family nutrient uptake outer membrane protein [Marinoscillum sp.]